jgi:ABC-type Fe3+ transport system substrate-binding protein
MTMERITTPLTSRRQLMLSGASFAAWAYLPKFARAADQRDPRLIVVILRGALDGLATVAPIGDPDYAGLREGIAIAKDGPEKTEHYLTALKANLGRTSGGGDRDVARDILADICDIGVGNSYYVGLMRSGTGGPEQKQWGDAIKVILPTFGDHAGSHVNISGVAVARYAPNKENAIKFLEFLISPEAQKVFADANYEFPIRAGVAPIDIVAAWGSFKSDPVNVSALGKNNAEAVRIMDRAGWR